MPQHELFGEHLTRFYSGGVFCRAEYRHAARRKLVHDASRQRRLGSYESKINVVLFGELKQGGDVGGADIYIVRRLRRAGIAGGGEYLRGVGALRQLPDDGVFPSAGADNQYFQAEPPILLISSPSTGEDKGEGVLRFFVRRGEACLALAPGVIARRAYSAAVNLVPLVILALTRSLY